ncbi:hypothetical protein AGMMS49959_03470 [Planctomycetales bacterium]|nr:hypothetical protein AGMMS49959_03470 [Planctomycetales bacterium]
MSIPLDNPADAGAGAEMRKLAEVLATGQPAITPHRVLGDIVVGVGKSGKGGYGLTHIIERRAQQGKSTAEIAAILYLINQALRDGEILPHPNPNRQTLNNRGIVAIIERQDGGKWLLTGYDDFSQKKEATDAITAVIANYGYAPDYSYVCNQVGAVVTSRRASIVN